MLAKYHHLIKKEKKNKLKQFSYFFQVVNTKKMDLGIQGKILPKEQAEGLGLTLPRGHSDCFVRFFGIPVKCEGTKAMHGLGESEEDVIGGRDTNHHLSKARPYAP